MDSRNRVYYVDHNTRTTTWQCPNSAMMNNLREFNLLRQNRTFAEVGRQRSLFNQSTELEFDDTVLGALPEGYGEVGIWKVGGEVGMVARLIWW